MPLIVSGGGFQVNLQGQKQTGMGHCGTGLSLGASSAFFNPGALSFTDSNHIALGGSFITSKVQYLEPYPGIYTTETISQPGTPFTFYSAFRLKQEAKWNFGIAVYTPFGSGIKYEDDWKGQFVLREMSLRTIFVQPTLSYQVHEKIGVGVGYVYGLGQFALRKGVPVQDTLGNYGEGILEGKSAGHGFNLGLFIVPNDHISLGLSYRSSVAVDIDDGIAEFSMPPYLQDSFPSTSFSTKIRLPQVISAGVGLKATNKLMLALDVNFVGWGSYDTLAFDFAKNTENLEDISSPRKYKDAMIFRTGIQYQWNDKLHLRAGAYYDLTPVQDGYITPETPDSDKLGLSTGASYLLTEHLNIDISFLYVQGKARTDTNLETGFGGTWSVRALIPGVAVEYIF